MGHYISGIVGRADDLSRFAQDHGLHSPAKLIGELGFLPLSDEHLDHLFPEQGDFDHRMTYLSEALKEALLGLSQRGAVAYIETEYHGGQRGQAGVAYDRGECVYGPRRDRFGPISEALAFLGVQGEVGGIDAFQAAGFGRHRHNEDWIEESNPADSRA